MAGNICVAKSDIFFLESKISIIKDAATIYNAREVSNQGRI